MRVLLLGGTTEASRLASSLAQAGVDAVFSYAGRTAAPVAQPLPMRVGGFGGVDGLQAYLLAERFTHVVDATHPFAAQMSHNAVQACAACNVPLLALERPAWQAGIGDVWTRVADMDGALRALPVQPTRIFLAIGRQQVAPFLEHTPHWYLLRLVDPVLDLPAHRGYVVLDRGPFTLAGDRALLQAHGVTHIVAKNAGGTGAQAKLIAARELGLPVILVDRPWIPSRPTVGSVDEVLHWLGSAGYDGVHRTDRGV